MARFLGTKDVQLFASAARTASANGTDQTNPGYKGVKVRINVTASGSTDSQTWTIQGKDSAGVYYTILASAARTTTGVETLTVYPGLTETANVDASDVLPRFWRLISTMTGDTATWSAYATLLP